MSDSVTNLCQRVFEDHQDRNDQVVQGLASAWKDLDGLVQARLRSFDLGGWRQPDRGRLQSLVELVEGPGREFLLDPVGRYRRTGPQARALAAIEAYEAGISDLLRRIPETVVLSGVELAEIARARGSRSWRIAVLRGRRRPRPFRLRTAVRNSLARESLRRGRIVRDALHRQNLL